jgi:hypothetical protein
MEIKINFFVFSFIENFFLFQMFLRKATIRKAITKDSVKKIKVGYTWCTVFVLITSFFERLAYYGIRSELFEISNNLFQNFEYYCKS